MNGGEVTHLDVLRRGYELLNEQGWTKGAFARNEDGESCRALDPQAHTYCSLGAVYAAAGELSPENGWKQSELYDKAVWELHQTATQTKRLSGGNFKSVSDWNDALRWRQVERGWLDTIARAEEAIA